MLLLQPADIFLVRGKSFLSKAIRFFTRAPGEKPSTVSHVGLITTPGDIRTATAVEALNKVRRAPFAKHVGETVEVYRPTNLKEWEVHRIARVAEQYVGRPYGYLKIITQMIDGGLLFGHYITRRLTNSDIFPICSWLVAHAYLSAGKDFGVHPGAATPDDIEDFVKRNPDKYTCVFPLGTLTEAS